MFLGSTPYGFLAIGGASGGGGGSGTNQKQPRTFKVGTTADAPVAGTSTWQYSDSTNGFAGSYVLLFLNGRIVPFIDMGDGTPFQTKLLASDTLAIGNYAWVGGDELTYALITPNP